MPQHIGIIACSAEGASLCYRTICLEGAERLGPHGHPEVSMHGFSLADYVDCLERGDWAGVGALMLGSAEKLAAIGADILICPDNTIHQALPLIADRLPHPFLSIADVVAEEAAARGFRRVGVSGTKWLVASEVYPAALAARGIGCMRPSAAETEATQRFIMDELNHAVVSRACEASFQRIFARMKEEGCDAVALACTEIPLIMNDANSPLPTLDSTRLLARAALRRAIEAEPAAA